MSLFRNAATMLLSTVVAMALGFLASIVSARWLSLEDRGVLALAASVSATLVLLAQLGWPPGTIYRLRRMRAAPESVASATISGMLGLSVLTVLLVLLLREPVLATFLAGAPPLILYLSLANVPLGLLANAFSGIARGIDRFDLMNWYRSLRAFGQLAATVGVLVLAGLGLLELLAVQLAVGAVLTLSLVLVVLRQTGVRRGPEVAEAREISKVGAKAWVSALAGTIHERVDVFMLAALLSDAREVAVYAIAVSASSLVKLAPEAMAGALLPTLAGSRDDEAGEVSAALVRHAILWMALVLVALGPASPWLIPLIYGQAYAASVPVFIVLLMAVPFLTVYRLLNRYFMAIDRQRINIQLQTGGVVLNLLLNVILIPRHGALGAALASLISYGVEGVACALVFHRVSGVPLSRVLLFRRADLDPYVRRVRARTRR